MKTLLKVGGFVVGFVVVVALMGFILSLVGTILKLLIPVAILASVGYVLWKVFGGAGKTATEDPAKKPEVLPEAKPQQDVMPAQKKAGLSEEEARRVFEQMRRPDQK